MFDRTQVLAYDKLHKIEIMMCKSYYKFAYTMNTHSKISYNACDLIVMIVMHGEDMHVMFVRIEQVDPMFAVLVL